MFVQVIYFLKKNTEGFCIIQVDDNVFCKPVTNLFTNLRMKNFKNFAKIKDFSNFGKIEDF